MPNTIDPQESLRSSISSILNTDKISVSRNGRTLTAVISVKELTHFVNRLDVIQPGRKNPKPVSCGNVTIIRHNGTIDLASKNPGDISALLQKAKSFKHVKELQLIVP